MKDQTNELDPKRNPKNVENNNTATYKKAKFDRNMKDKGVRKGSRKLFETHSNNQNECK